MEQAAFVCGGVFGARRSTLSTSDVVSSRSAFVARRSNVGVGKFSFQASQAKRSGVIVMATETDTMVKADSATGMHTAAAVSAEISKAMAAKGIDRPVIIGVAADSGCGKSTFLRRVADIFGTKLTKAHTPQGEFLTVICLDDFHTHDRMGRREAGVTALDPAANNFDLMYEQVKALKEGKSVMKPIYNHETGEIDPPELVEPNHLVVIEGLHPIYDERVRELLDFSVYLDLADEVKIAWKIQRDMAERGHTLEAILASIESRKPDFAAYIDPQKKHADVVMEILPTELIPDDDEKKVLRVRLIQNEGIEGYEPVFLFDEGSTMEWIPCGKKLACSYPGIKFRSGPDTYYDKSVDVVDCDGGFEKLDEMIYVESHMNNTSTKFYGEVTQQLLKNSSAPGSKNGTGLFQVIMALKMREAYERITGRSITPALS
ncbi:hypothetical protein NDN08_000991 [Rhodosorus marinus]|uniref:Phosphoribulokinase n=1 Tax=Rhodosorus marinus TaxID=101924 RepID=A0AAV8UPJ3_9RHOD|nr:hypothetical protein NDN08_000991 [Rhodosorus marinus]